LPFQESPHPFLDKLLDLGGDVLSKYFIRSIRSYNSMFAFTSLGAKIDTCINRAPGHMYSKLMGRFITELGLCCQMRVDLPCTCSSIFMILRTKSRIEYQFSIEIGNVIAIAKLTKQLWRVW
jgi:hypothetical protein